MSCFVPCLVPLPGFSLSHREKTIFLNILCIVPACESPLYCVSRPRHSHRPDRRLQARLGDFVALRRLVAGLRLLLVHSGSSLASHESRRLVPPQDVAFAPQCCASRPRRPRSKAPYAQPGPPPPALPCPPRHWPSLGRPSRCRRCRCPGIIDREEGGKCWREGKAEGAWEGLLPHPHALPFLPYPPTQRNIVPASGGLHAGHLECQGGRACLHPLLLLFSTSSALSTPTTTTTTIAASTTAAATARTRPIDPLTLLCSYRRLSSTDKTWPGWFS